MRILGLDTATSACSAALWCEGHILARRFAAMQRGQSETLMPMVRAVMAESGSSFEALDAIAVTVGPGAFTGVRIGLAAARAMARAAEVPLLGVTTFEAVAHAQTTPRRSLLVALDTKRDDVYVQLFGRDLNPLLDPRACMPESVPAILPATPVDLVGDAASSLHRVLIAAGRRDQVVDGPVLPDAAVVAALAARRIAERPPKVGDPMPAPLYLRPPDATPMPQR